MDHKNYIRKEYLLDKLSQFVSFDSGLIQETYFTRDEYFGCPIARALFNGESLGFGIDLDFTSSMIKSLAEALERYTLIHINEKKQLILNQSARELKSLDYSCFYPEYDLYEEAVYKNIKFKKMTPDLKTAWVASKNFSDDQIVWIPASLIYKSKYISNPLTFPTTNGMSCSFFESSLERSILELIERDSFMYMWLSKIPGEEIVFDKLYNRSLKKLLAGLDPIMKRVKVVLKYTDIQIPCVFVLFKGRANYDEPAFFITGSADCDIEKACYKALLEFTSLYNHYLTSKQGYKDQAEKIIRKKLKIQNFGDRTVFYTIHKNFNKCAFLFETNKSVPLSSLTQKWTGEDKDKLLKNSLSNKNIFLVDMTPKEMHQSDIYITRAYSPDLLEINAGEDTRFNSLFLKKRIDEINKVFNKKTELLNEDPHCYP